MPDLTIIAGCNGAGKSTFSASFLPEGLTSFDYDRLFLDYYNSLPDSELREEIARNKTTENFESSIQKTWANNTDFCYETNFDSHPLFWPQKFREKCYQINLIFFCLDNQEIARHRIQVRTEFKGHFVDNTTIDLRWKAGYKNANLHFRFFDNILFVDNSTQNEIYTNLLQIEKGEVVLMAEQLPDYFRHRLPDIFDLLEDG
ncbi:zeta toxin family protein [Litoribacter ruber]|uniref:zeta toxin family protein n=1 Tax=Litoribacter ruber TaxID=702568 RepID=UPI001BDAA97B|nr:zeta toxin family protein [Litoribacter ruber]MBT0812888.1 zeta toxin family protein [Litoribacter ruber]